MQLAMSGTQAAVVVPVAVILMPGPGPADERLLQDHLVVVVVDLVLQQSSIAVDDTTAADDGRIDVVAQFVLDVQADGAPFAVGPAGRRGGAGGRPGRSCRSRLDLFRVEQTGRDEESIACVLRQLL